ncbi:protealysin inhibitor emfourin [Micromonospora sp. SL1-18]|uniref:protealysin inhibitor emfourin n=1 Tax=Micromonospora sp. SL1-18 TaxID=3399128 RepID=UPI003A4DA41C
MRTTPAAAAALVALLVPIAACAQSGETGTTPTSAPPTAPTTAPISPPTTAPAAGTEPAGKPGVDVVLTKSGGIAGVKDTVTVTPDGRWTKVDRAGATRTGQLDPADLDRLRRLTADRRLLAEGTATATECSDAFTYQLTVGAVTTGYVDCSPKDAPPATAAVVELLTQATD